MVEKWKRFWFDSYDYNAYRLFQILFGTTIFLVYLFRFLDYEFLYSEAGILPYSLLSAIGEVSKSYINWEILAKNEIVGKSLYIAFLLGLLAMICNKQNRYLLIFLWIAHMVFLRRNPMALYGADMVVSFWFLYMIFADPKNSKAMMWNSLSTRCIQIQLCIIYVYSGLEKIRGMTWWRGDALWYAFGNTQLTYFDMSFLAHMPLVIVALTYLTVIWETYFAVLIWFAPIRKYILLFGLIFHLSIALTMNLVEFSVLMLAPYLLFLERERAGKWYQYLRSKISWI